MSKIHQLSANLISKIAAGEVIERPVFAVKELIDNSLDAGATSILVHIEESGLKKIQVIDNGEGMNQEDLLLCFKPHTTSKIYKEDDLLKIKTYGFRGEALSSISAIGTVSILSRTRNDLSGTLLELKNGELIKISPAASTIGTVVSVSNLFASVPVRKKFLKSNRTEFRHIIEVVMNFALANPKVKFLLTHNKKVILDLPATPDLDQRINILFGKTFRQNLVPIVILDQEVTVSGFLGTPQIASSRQIKQFLFVNNRQIFDKQISLTIKEAYGSFLRSEAQPVFILFLSVPFEQVDVNIHPRKEQISFMDNQPIYQSIQNSLKMSLKQNSLTFRNLVGKDDIFGGITGLDRGGKIDSLAGQLLKESVSPWNVKNEVEIIKTDEISQLHNLYLVIQTKNGFLLIDQHAAHERILYEQFQREFLLQKNTLKRYSLPVAIPIDLSVSETEVLKEYLDKLRKLGFEIEDFTQNSFIIRSVPWIFKDRDISSLLHELIDDFMITGNSKEIDQQTNRMLSFIACRAAIKAGEKLTKDEAKNLIDQLEKTDNNSTCPHGRPTKIEVSLDRLNSVFKRK